MFSLIPHSLSLRTHINIKFFILFCFLFLIANEFFNEKNITYSPSVLISETISVMVALHACDVATDDALYYAIQTGMDAMIVAPCCHKEVFFLRHIYVVKTTAQTILQIVSFSISNTFVLCFILLFILM